MNSSDDVNEIKISGTVIGQPGISYTKGAINLKVFEMEIESEWSATVHAERVTKKMILPVCVFGDRADSFDGVFERENRVIVIGHLRRQPVRNKAGRITGYQPIVSIPKGGSIEIYEEVPAYEPL